MKKEVRNNFLKNTQQVHEQTDRHTNKISQILRK